MEYLVVAFRSRTHTVRFSSFLSKNGINNTIVNTPKEAMVGCGLSVRVNKSILSLIRKAVYSVNLNSFAGIFMVKEIANKRIVVSV